MEYFVKWGCVAIGSILSFFTPIKPLIICLVVFIGIDFVTGIWASHKRSKRKGESWAFESDKMWKTVQKLVFAIGGIVLAWMLGTVILPQWDLRLHNLFAGFVCGVEFWSYLENAAEISEHPMFRWVRKYLKKEVEEKLKIKIENPENTTE
jgi:phage-related holin